MRNRQFLRNGAAVLCSLLLLGGALQAQGGVSHPRGPVDHIRYVPQEWVVAPGQQAQWEPLLAIFARPGDAIEYRLEPMSRHKFAGIQFTLHADRFEAPVISPSGREMTVRVKGNAPPFQTKSTLLLKPPGNGATVALDPLVVVGSPY